VGRGAYNKVAQLVARNYSASREQTVKVSGRVALLPTKNFNNDIRHALFRMDRALGIVRKRDVCLAGATDGLRYRID
jgi:hypothetical protein